MTATADETGATELDALSLGVLELTRELDVLLAVVLKVATLLIAALLVDVLVANVLAVDDDDDAEAQYWLGLNACTRSATQEAASSE